MNTYHNTRTARAARAIAARLESVPYVCLYERTERAESDLFRISHYLNRYCGSYSFEGRTGDPLVIVRKNRV